MTPNPSAYYQPSGKTPLTGALLLLVAAELAKQLEELHTTAPAGTRSE